MLNISYLLGLGLKPGISRTCSRLQTTVVSLKRVLDQIALIKQLFDSFIHFVFRFSFSSNVFYCSTVVVRVSDSNVLHRNMVF